ncbi:hypothetical protein [Rhizobium miluonense]|uniref:Uncharacterized protein n=1 Tax=Rhizobium miluonense TaxID=411945 RepID=A0A1C3VY30_9HYPH|nr:hypothetical protein [Rhizobium miluonense]SCB32575.1 hypothetical protein GA0061102_1019101 [Rhizobium miluonense]
MIAGAAEPVPHNTSWPVDFERIREKLAQLPTPYLMTIDHISRTPLPGLAEKRHFIDAIIEKTIGRGGPKTCHAKACGGFATTAGKRSKT